MGEQSSLMVSDNTDAAKSLIDAGCNIHKTDNEGNTPFEEAILKDEVQVTII